LLPFKKILCPTDFSLPALEALQYGVELALHFGAELHLVHVISPVPPQYPYPTPPFIADFDLAAYQKELAASATKALQELAAQKVSPQVRTSVTVATGEAATEIARLAREIQVDLIVIASHGQTGWRRLVFGSVARKVMSLAPCPVLTIRPPGEEEK
jgi:nucleotide-binding universal stress UspA family protein